MSTGADVLMAMLFWPAYLPVCLAASEAGENRASPTTRDPIFSALEQQVARIAIEPRRSELFRSVVLLEEALESRKRELERLDAAEKRLRDLGGRLGREESDRRLVEGELQRLEAARVEAAQDLARVRESIVRLTLRLEVFELRASQSSLEEQLAELREELDRLVDARHEVEAEADGFNRSLAAARSRATSKTREDAS